MTSNKNIEEWEKEFDEKIDSGYGDWWVEEYGETYLDEKAVKSFIQSLLDQQRQSIIEMVEEMKDWDEPPPEPGYEDSDDPGQQYQCGLYDGLNRIKELLTNDTK